MSRWKHIFGAHTWKHWFHNGEEHRYCIWCPKHQVSRDGKWVDTL